MDASFDYDVVANPLHYIIGGFLFLVLYATPLLRLFPHLRWGIKIFFIQTHEQKTVSCIEEIYKKYVTIAKEKYPDMFLDDNYSPHSMRHSTACHLLEAGVDIVTIKNILGHVSVQTTQIYAEMSQDNVDKKLIEWNQNWFGEFRQDKSEQKNECDRIPQFLKRH